MIMSIENLIKYLILVLAIVVLILFTTHSAHAKLIWKNKPQLTQLAKENDNVKLNCEFENIAPTSPAYFVIWYKDGASQNVLSLNDQLANLNATNYEINGKYNLIIKNVSRNDSGVYTCQLFQSNDMIASVNLTVLVPPKYARLSLNHADENPYATKNKGYLVENDRIKLECCTNSDANPAPQFKWYKIAKVDMKTTLVNGNDASLLLNSYHKSVCNYLNLNLTRMDNDYIFKCTVSNEALSNTNTFLEDSYKLSVEYKPETLVHLNGYPNTINKLTLVENSSISLYCNATARPHAINYEWYFNDALIKESRGNTLMLSNLMKNQAGNYACKSSNKHGYSKSYFNIELLYAKVIAANRTLNYDTESQNLRQPNSIFLSSSENASITLTCEIDANPLVENGHWYYYQINKDNQIINKVILSNWISNTNVVLNKTEKRFYTQLTLNNITLNHSGYYACAINFILSDNLNQTLSVNSNATYFLQVKYTPIIKAVKQNVFANQYDQVELACDVKSNPQSIISWFYKSKELFNNYKYNITNTVYRQINRTHMDNIENMHHYRSFLAVKAVTQFDYGDYYCKANNIIGGSSQVINIKKKHKPETPIDFKLVEVTSNSVQLSWLSGSNGGENSTFGITINQTINFTTFTEDFTEETENKFNLIEIKGLQPQQAYEFKLNAFNSLGTSESTNAIKVMTLKTTLKNKKIPQIHNAQFNDIREAICFDLDAPHDLTLRNYFNSDKLNDLFVKIDVSFNDAVARDLFQTNKTFKIKKDKINPSKTSTFMINMNKLKYGQNCIMYSKLVQLDWQLKNASRQLNQYLTVAPSTDSRKKVFVLNSSLGMAQSQSYLSSSAILSHPKMASLDLKGSIENFGKNFFEFKRLHTVNITLCYKNDSNICAEKAKVYDFNPDFSTYITLIAIGCSSIFIFIILLIASLCCCCCRKQTKPATVKKTDINSKLVISSFPIMSTQQKNFDYSDSSTKSSQQHILNGSSESHSSSSSTSSHSGENYLRNEKIYYKNNNNLVDQCIYDPNEQTKYVNSGYKMEYSKNSPSVATLESDASSSTSLENKTITTSNGGKSSTTHSPYTVMAENQQNNYFSSSSSPSNYSTNGAKQINQPQSYQYHHQNPQNTSKQQTLIYNGSNAMYIKTFQQPPYQPQQQQQQSLQVKNNSPESGYSTPLSSNITKKLVYEVIV